VVKTSGDGTEMPIKNSLVIFMVDVISMDITIKIISVDSVIVEHIISGETMASGNKSNSKSTLPVAGGVYAGVITKSIADICGGINAILPRYMFKNF
jgi:hypothetical protein